MERARLEPLLGFGGGGSGFRPQTINSKPYTTHPSRSITLSRGVTLSRVAILSRGVIFSRTVTFGSRSLLLPRGKTGYQPYERERERGRHNPHALNPCSVLGVRGLVFRSEQNGKLQLFSELRNKQNGKVKPFSKLRIKQNGKPKPISETFL